MARAKKSQNRPNFSLDTVSEKKRRGPKQRVDPRVVRGRADNRRVILANVWSRLWPAFEQVKTEADVSAALELASPYHEEFRTEAQRIFNILKDPKFPKTRQGRINFLADSSAGLGRVSSRRSRDICAAERAAARKKGQIIHYEYYIECSCGFKGHSMGHACPLCKAAILFPIGLGVFG
jgi:hypothetical protein